MVKPRMALVGLAALLAGAAPDHAAKPKPLDATPEARAAMDELWRRGRCVLSSIVMPAEKASRVPADIGGKPVLDGRLLTRRGAFRAFAVDGDTMWLATDARLEKIDLAARKRAAAFTPADGLPDSPVEELVVDGARLWIVTRSGLGLLDTAANRFVTSGLPAFRVARIARSPRAVWVVADSGTFAFDPSDGAWHKHPPVPPAADIARRLDQGVWQIRWRAATERLIDDAAVAGGALWVLALGSLSRLDAANPKAGGTAWRQAAPDAWAIRADGDVLWVLTSQGVERHDRAGGVSRYTPKDGLADGRHRFIAVTEKAVWVATDPLPDAKYTRYEGGGLSRFDKAAGTWSRQAEINGIPATPITCLAAQGGRVWAASVLYDKLVTQSAHPGMMHVKRAIHEVTGLSLHIGGDGGAAWESLKCPLPAGQPRYILGQKGEARLGALVPKAIVGLAVSESAAYGLYELYPADFYGGYCHSAGPFARRAAPGGPWSCVVEDAGAQVGLEGEQPRVLLVSESHGERVIFAEGQPRALHVGIHASRAWALSESALACEVEPGRWQKVTETRSRFYWEAAAAAGGGGALWIGGDAGTVSRLDMKTLRSDVVACLSGRKIERLALDPAGRLWVKSAPSTAALPTDLLGAPRVEAKEVAVYDGKAWRAAGPEESFPAAAPDAAAWTCEGNLLIRKESGGAGRRVSYLRGAFHPAVLCVETDAKAVWLKVHEGIVRIGLPEESP